MAIHAPNRSRCTPERPGEECSRSSSNQATRDSAVSEEQQAGRQSEAAEEDSVVAKRHRPIRHASQVPGWALSPVFRAKMRDALSRAGVAQDIDPTVWLRVWTVHVQQIGRGAQANR
jgi:hypothetical protein